MNLDVLVIGGGPGGYVAAIKAAQAGKKVGVVEKANLGGVCLNWGCIPTKALLHTAKMYNMMKKSSDFGLEVDMNNVKVNFDKVIERSRATANRLSKGVQFLMSKNKIEVIYGFAKLVSKNQVEVEQEGGKKTKITAKNIILATGTRPRELPNLKIDGKVVLSSKQAMVVPKAPKSIVIIGAGAIGIEFAYFFNSFGTKVTILEMQDRILPVEDEEVSKELARSFKKQGIEILTGTKADKIEVKKDGASVKIGSKTLDVDNILLAIGVQANVEGIGLEKVGVKLDKGYLKVNSNYQTTVPSIYGIGDVAGPPWLAHVASAEGEIAVQHICGEKVTPLDYESIPGCTYCVPQVASVGLTEAKAKEKGYSVKVGRFPIRANGKALALGDEEGFVKIVSEAKYGEILGCHIIGPEATEMITEIAMAKNLEATYEEIFHTVHPHPTVSESIAEAAMDVAGKALHI